MRNPLFKRIPRNIKRDWTKHLGLFAILTLTILAGTSFNATLQSVTDNLNKSNKLCKIEDGEFETSDLLSKESKKYFKDNDISLVNNFYYTDDAWDTDSTLLVFDEKDKLNIPTLFEGRMPEKDDEIVFDRIALNNHGMNIGDKITIEGNTYTVTGTAAFSDYSSLFKNNSDLVMDTSSFGVSMTSHDGFKKLSDSSSVTYRYSYRYTNRNMRESELFEDDTEIQKELMQNGEGLLNFVTAQNNQSITFLLEDMGTDGPTMKVFAYILEIIIAFIFVILTSDNIERESGIIGTLRALGYTRGEIIMHYLFPTFVVTFAAALIGNGLGYTVMLEPFKNLYYTIYSIAPIKVQFSAGDFLVSTAVPVAIILVINYLMLRNKLSLSPLKFLRHDLKKGRAKKAVRLPDIKFFKRFRLRIILENAVNYLLLFVGIFLASFLLLFGIGFKPMFDNYENTINDSINYEYSYVLKTPVDVEGGEKLEMYEMKSYCKSAGKDIDIVFYGIDNDSEFFAPKKLPKYENEIIISTQVRDKMGIDVGNKLTVADSKHDKEYSFYVAGVCDHESSMAVFMKRELLNSVLDKDEDFFNAYVSNTELDIDDHYVLKKITREDMIGTASQMIASFDTVIDVIKYFSILIYFVLMYVLTKVIIEKNSLSISFLKVFGYNNREIGKVYLNASTITVMASLILCIPLEVAAFKEVMHVCTSMIEAYLRINIPVEIYALVVIAGIVTYFAVNALHMQKIKRIPGCEALKIRD